MKFLHLTLLASAYAASQVVAQFTYKVEATFKGKPIPASEIKFTPMNATKQSFQVGSPTTSKNAAVRKRANPTATSANWCGSVNHATSLNKIKVVHGYFQHPACSKRTGVTVYPQAAAPWVGLDGDTWTTAYLQSGTLCHLDTSTGSFVNEAWWQWYPSGSFFINTLPVAANDWFEVTLNVTSSTAGKVTISNVSQGYSYSITVSGAGALGQVDADWVLERPVYGSGLAGFADFTDVWFQEAYATRVSGSLGILGALQYQITGTCASAEYDNSHEVSWSL